MAALTQSFTARFCLRCSCYRGIHYVLDVEHSYHLLVECPHGEYPTAMVRGLPVRTVESRKLVKQKQQAKQIELL